MAYHCTLIKGKTAAALINLMLGNCQSGQHKQ